MTAAILPVSQIVMISRQKEKSLVTAMQKTAVAEAVSQTESGVLAETASSMQMQLEVTYVVNIIRNTKIAIQIAQTQIASDQERKFFFMANRKDGSADPNVAGIRWD